MGEIRGNPHPKICRTPPGRGLTAPKVRLGYSFQDGRARRPPSLHLLETMRLCLALTVPALALINSRAGKYSDPNCRSTKLVRQNGRIGWRWNMSKPMAFAVDQSRTIISSLIHGRQVSGLDIAWLRREVFADAEVSRDSAEELFAVERADIVKAPEWTQFFVERVTEHVIWQSRPTGVVSDEQAHWLIHHADQSMSAGALAVLVNVLAEAHRVPQWFLAAVRTRVARGWPGVNEALQGALAG